VVTAALAGITIDRGLIEDDQRGVAAFFPEYSHLFDDQKRKITIEHLLTMSSGLEWNEWDKPLTSRENDLIQLFVVSDPVEYILGKPVVHEAGAYWYYSGGDVNLLGVLFHHATGYRIDSFSAEYLFGPLGISVFEWQQLNPQIVYASGELYLRPRDLAKFGYLFLNEGVSNGTRVILTNWIENRSNPMCPPEAAPRRVGSTGISGRSPHSGERGSPSPRMFAQGGAVRQHHLSLDRHAPGAHRGELQWSGSDVGADYGVYSSCGGEVTLRPVREGIRVTTKNQSPDRRNTSSAASTIS